MSQNMQRADYRAERDRLLEMHDDLVRTLEPIATAADVADAAGAEDDAVVLLPFEGEVTAGGARMVRAMLRGEGGRPNG